MKLNTKKTLYYLYLIILSINMINSGLKNKDLSMIEIKTKFCPAAVLKEKNKLAEKYSTLDDYTNGKKPLDAIKNIIDTQNLAKNDVKKLILKFYIWLIALIFSIICFISWYVFLFCCCCKCLMFNKENRKSSCCKWCHTLIFIIFHLIVVSASLASLIFIKNMRSSIDDSVCSFNSFFTDFIEGDDNYWYGTSKVHSLISEILLPIKNFSEQNSGSSPNFKDNYNIYSEKIEKELISIENRKSSYKIDIQPSYKDDLNSQISKMRDEYKSIPKALTDFLNEITSSFSGTLDYNSIENNVDSIFENLDSLTENVIDAYESVGKNFVIIRDILADYVLHYYIYYFICFISFSLIIILCFILFCCFKWTGMKVLIHIFWILEVFLVWSFLIIGGLLGLTGDIFSLIGPTVGYVLSENYLKNPDNLLGTSKDVADYIITCVNGDGKLYDKLDVIDSLIFSDLQEQIDETEEYQKNINSTSTASQSAIQYVDNLLLDKNFNKITGNEQTVAEMLIELNKGSKDDINEAICSNVDDSKKNKCFFILNCKNELENLANNYLIKYSNTFTNQMNEIDNEWEQTTKIIYNLKDDIKNISDSINYLLSKMNCKFLGIDLISYMKLISDDFGNSCIKVGYCCICLTLAAYLAVYFIGALYYWEDNKNENKNANNMINVNDKIMPKMENKLELPPTNNDPVNQGKILHMNNSPLEDLNKIGISSEYLNLNNKNPPQLLSKNPQEINNQGYMNIASNNNQVSNNTNNK